MKLSQKAIMALQGKDNRSKRLKLALKLDFGERWIDGLLEQNKHNGALTTHTATQVIQEETGLLPEDILEESEKENEPTKVA